MYIPFGVGLYFYKLRIIRQVKREKQNKMKHRVKENSKSREPGKRLAKLGQKIRNKSKRNF